MLKIRLQRVGRKNDPSFRVIVGEDSNAAQSGKFLEILGSYDARSNRLELKADRIKHWLAQGVRTSDTVHNLLITGGVIEGKKIDVAPKAPAKPAEAPAEAPAPATAKSAETAKEEVTPAETPAEEASAETPETTESTEPEPAPESAKETAAEEEPKTE